MLWRPKINIIHFTHILSLITYTVRLLFVEDIDWEVSNRVYCSIEQIIPELLWYQIFLTGLKTVESSLIYWFVAILSSWFASICNHKSSVPLRRNWLEVALDSAIAGSNLVQLRDEGASKHAIAGCMTSDRWCSANLEDDCGWCWSGMASHLFSSCRQSSCAGFMSGTHSSEYSTAPNILMTRSRMLSAVREIWSVHPLKHYYIALAVITAVKSCKVQTLTLRLASAAP